MAARTVPHAYPMSSEYEFANPSKIYDQNFGEGKEGGGITLSVHLPPLCCRRAAGIPSRELELQVGKAGDEEF